ncbi:MAG: DUF4062 domain-containing protein [Bryobacteraceae bacterium]
MVSVFLSSVVRGFEQHRDAAAAAIDSFPGFKCVRMEQFGASALTALDECLQQLRQCDWYVGILGARYGSVLGPSGCSYTEAEYDEAVRLEIPRLMFLASVDVIFVESEDFTRRQREFRDKVSIYFRGEFKTSEELQIEITKSLAKIAIKSFAKPIDPKNVTWLFVPFVTCQAGFDTGVAITNPSFSLLGIPERAGKCTIFYTGEVLRPQQIVGTTDAPYSPSQQHIGLLPIVQESAVIPAGKQLTFVLTTGGNYGIAATPGFQGYLLIRCEFPNARGVAFTYVMTQDHPTGGGAIPVEVLAVP